MWLKKVISFLLIIGFGAVLPLVAFESYLRLTADPPVSFYQPDSHTGTWHVAGASGYFVKPCLKTFVQFNSQGLRDVEHSIVKPSGIYRIVVLGDSFAEAMQVPLEDSFPKILEKELQRLLESKKTVEVINLGHSSFGTDQELLALRHYGLKYNPDLVILAFLTANDVRNNYYVLEEDYNGEPIRHPYFTLDTNGTLLLNQPSSSLPCATERPLWKRVAYRFRLPFWARERLDPLLHSGKGSMLTVTNEVGHEEHFPLDYGVYLKSYPSEWEYAWRITECLIKEIAKESRQSGAEFLLVSLADALQLSPGIKNSLLDMEKPIKYLQEIGRENSIPYLPLLPLFQKDMETRGYQLEDIHYSCDGHWTPLGHRLAGEGVARYIYEEIIK